MHVLTHSLLVGHKFGTVWFLLSFSFILDGLPAASKNHGWTLGLISLLNITNKYKARKQKKTKKNKKKPTPTKSTGMILGKFGQLLINWYSRTFSIFYDFNLRHWKTDYMKPLHAYVLKGKMFYHFTYGVILSLRWNVKI